MPSISKIRFTNVIYENGGKRYNDMTFKLDGQNTALLLENGGGKTVFIQTALQAVIPHIDMADRKIKDTLNLENGPAHIAIEWVLNDDPRRYAVTGVTLYIENNTLNSYKFVYDYGPEDPHSIEKLPFSIKNESGAYRPASKGEISEYYYRMKNNYMKARIFDSIKGYGEYIEEKFKIIPSEWKSIAEINSGEGNVDEYFSKCKTTPQLLNNLLIPVVEEAIEGENKQQFVETFEKQREHFKKNKMLGHQIYQSQIVKEKVDEFARDYKIYSDYKIKYDELRIQGKGLYEIISSQLSTSKERLSLNEAVNEGLQKDKKELHRKELSYDIHRINNKIDTFKKENELVHSAHEEKQEKLNSYINRKEDIGFTLITNRIKQGKDNISRINIKLKEFDNEDTLALKSRLSENESFIKGYFDDKLFVFNKEKQLILDKIAELKEAKEHTSKTGQELNNEEKALDNHITKLDTLINEYTSKIEKLVNNISDTPITDCKTFLTKQENSYDKLNEIIDSINTNIVEVNEKIKVLQEEKVINNEGIIRASSELDHHKSILEEIDELKNQLIHEIESQGHFLYIGSNIYEKSESIVNGLQEKLTKLINEKEKAMEKERACKRIYDTYMSSKTFSAEPLVENNIDNMRNVKFVELGTTYIKSIIEAKGLTEEELFNKYPLWPMTVITTEDEVSKVEITLKKKEKELFYPIIVMSVSEINQIIDDERNYDLMDSRTYIYPINWLNNLSNEGFSRWLEEAKIVGEKSEEERKDIEIKVAEISQLISRVNGYFHQHPLAKYELIEDKIKGLDHEVRQRKIRQELNIKELDRFNDEIKQLSTDLKIEEEKVNKTSEAIRVAKECVEYEQLIHNKSLELGKKTSQLDNVQNRIKKVNSQLEELNTNLKESEQKSYQYETEINKLTNHEIYKVLGNVTGTKGEIPYETLKRIRQDILDQLKGISADRAVIEHELGIEKQQLISLEKDLARKKKGVKRDLVLLESYYEAEEDELIDKIEALKPLCLQLSQKIRKLEDSILKERTLLEAKEKSLHSEFIELFKFDKPLEMIPKILDVDRQLLHENINKNMEEKIIFDKQIKDYEQLITKMKINNEHYLFMDIKAGDQKLEKVLSVDLKSVINELFTNMHIIEKRCKIEREKIVTKQLEFIEYCKDNVDDSRLKEAAITGIKQKESLDDLLKYKKGMEERIERIIRLLEDDKRESDSELQTFLTHLHSYVKNVAAELDMIQRKTSIKIEDSYKQIFVFDIPMWEEDKGKEALRNYINEIVEYFDRESDNEEYDEMTLRSEIEKKLSVKNLLNIVMNNQSIKIKCRKVTNDMKISKMATSWESSNRWSGGEKWSKNMTLFLSILNYISSKKQHLDSRQKNNRTVILDNPFGKASSNHVLNPVFKIADKLGFQIIALTAHAEGKFISDYFPVVYSCRLRKAKDVSKQVMTADKQINVAYLRENSPKSLVVLQEVEQLSLL